MSFHAKRAGKVAALATAFSTVVLIVQLTAPQLASAVVTPPDNVQSIFPRPGAFDGDGSGGVDATIAVDMAVLSSKPDGAAGGAHLTAVTSPADTTVTAATEVDWYYCDTGKVPPQAGCTIIGTDSTPTSATEATGYAGGTIDDAWDITWAIPGTLTGLTKDIVVEGCNGVAAADLSNCTSDIVTGVLLDGGTGATTATSSGRITSPLNGSAVPLEVANDVTATTSPELTSVAFGSDPTVGSGDDDNGGDGNSDVDTDGVFISKTPTTATATEKTWTATIPKNTLSEDEAALTLFASNNADYNSGVVSVECGATCTGPTKGLALDRNYIVAEKGVPGVPASVDLGKSPDCTSTPKFTTATVGSTVDLTGCVLDAFGAGVDSENVNWELTNSATPGGSFVGTPDFVTDASGNANASVTSSSGAAGSTTTITFCDDPSQTGDCATAGGANGGVGSKTFRINWTTGVSHARTVSLKLKDSLRARGHVSVTDGFSACADTVPVKIQKRGGGGWHTVKNTHTNATGGYKTKLKNKHGRYRALAPQTTASGDTCLKAHSPTRKH